MVIKAIKQVLTRHGANVSTGTAFLGVCHAAFGGVAHG